MKTLVRSDVPTKTESGIAVKYHYVSKSSKFDDETAQKVGEELEAAANQGVVIDAVAVVSIAQNPESALHPLLTWDDEVAAKNWREQEATGVIRSLYVVLETTNGKTHTQGAVFSVEKKPEAIYSEFAQNYMVISALRGPSEIDKTSIIANALSELQGWANKYAKMEIPELEPIIKYVNEVGG